MDRYRTIISAILASIAYQWAWPLMAICFIPMITKPITKKTLFGWGMLYMGTLHLFLIELKDDSHLIVAIILWLLASIYFGCFYGLGGLLLNAIQKRTQHHWGWHLPIIWPLIELAKSIGTFGNTNGNIGFSLSPITHYIPIYSIIGHIGVGILIVIVNILLLIIIQALKKSAPLKKPVILIICIVIAMVTLESPNQPQQSTQDVTIIQTGISQQQKQDPKQWSMLEDYYKKQLNGIQHGLVIFPETILPTNIKNRPFFNDLQNESNTKGIHILFGSFIDSGYNGSYFMGPNKDAIIYKKQRLMPFGETLPLRSILSIIVPPHILINDFKRGNATISIPFNGHHIQPIICLEGIYGKFYQSNTPSMIAILANNAWFNKSSAGKKLIKFAQVHAAEFQTPVLLAANYGHSAIISGTGKLIRASNHNNTSILNSNIQPNETVSIMNQWPWAGPLMIILVWILWITNRFYLNPTSKHPPLTLFNA